MRTRFQFTKSTLKVLLYSLVCFGVIVAHIVFQDRTITRGILGIAVVYLSFFYLRHSKIDVPIDIMLQDSRKEKYLISVFIGPMIAYWAAGEIYDMVIYFLNR